MYTLTVGIAVDADQLRPVRRASAILMAQAVFASLPILIVYLFFQKYIVRAVSGAASMRRAASPSLLLAAFVLAGCGARQAPNEIVVQRFFGACRAEYGTRTDVEAADGECGIMTTLHQQVQRRESRRIASG